MDCPQATFNHTHTVADLRAYCVYEMWREWQRTAAGAGAGVGAGAGAGAESFTAPNFHLIAGFPPQVVGCGDEATLADAELLSAAVVQKIIEEDDDDIDISEEQHQKQG